VCDINRVTNLK